MIELLEKYPKAAKVVREYYLERLLESLEDKSLPDEFKVHVREQGITNETISGMIKDNPRLLFSVFDENNLFISVNFLWMPPEEGWFIWTINPCDGSTQANKFRYKDRKETEKDAIEEAFKLLEGKL